MVHRSFNILVIISDLIITGYDFGLPPEHGGGGKYYKFALPARLSSTNDESLGLGDAL